MTKILCDRCGNELQPGHYQVNCNGVHDLCEACKAGLHQWLKGIVYEPGLLAPTAPEPEPTPEPAPKKKRSRG